MKKVPPWVWVLLLGAVLILPRLGSFGLWDPYEIKYADAARELAQGKARLPPGRPPLGALLAAGGVKLFGTSERGGRLPEALAGLLGLLAVYYAASGLFSRRAGLVAAALCALTPLYLLESRSMASDVAVAAAMTLALGGLGRFTLDGRPLDLLAGAAGVALSAFGAGGLLGVVPPLCAVTVGAALTRHYGTTGKLGAGALLAIGAGVTLLAGLAMLAIPGTPVTALVGGTVRHGVSVNTFEDAVKTVGFDLFPISAAAPLALGGFVAAPAPAADAEPAVRRRAWSRLYVLAFAAVAFVSYAIWNDRVTGELRFPGVGVLAVLVGGFADDLIEDQQSHPLLGLALAAGVLLLVRDLFLFPSDFGAAHILESLHWPAEVKTGNVLLALSTLLAAALLAALWVTSAARRRALLGVALGACGLFGLYNAQVVTPALSHHMSFKSIFDRYHKLANAGEPLRSFHIVGHGTAYYFGRPMDELPTPQALTDYLRGAAGGCVYAMVPNDELAALDQQIRAAQVPYFVVDASSSRFVLLASCLKPGERDQNPLRTYVQAVPPPNPRRAVHADFEGKVELLGADFPDSVSRLSEGKFTLTLYFHVKDRMPSGYRIFVHGDGCANRFNGDHAPLDGKLPTQFWSPGDYITDPYVIQVPLMTTPSCVYQVFMGFYLGDTRLKLTPGSAAEPGNSNRVPIGTIHVR